LLSVRPGQFDSFESFVIQSALADSMGVADVDERESSLLKLYADGGYQGPDFQAAMKRLLSRIRNRQTLGLRQRLRRLAKALARRENVCMAQSMSPIGERLGVPQSKSPLIPATRLNPPHAAKTMHSNMMFADRL
jgi:hypothetical protein